AVLNLAVVYQQHLNDHRQALVHYQQFLKIAGNAPEKAQVELAVGQLSSELAPKPPAHNVAEIPATKSNPPVAIVSPAVTNNVAANARPETVSPKTLAAPKYATQPVAKREPPPIPKEPAAEVVKLPDEPVFKPLPETKPPLVAATNSIRPRENLTKPVIPSPTRNRSTAVVAPEKPVEKVSRLNPINWFKRKPGTLSPVTELPSNSTAISRPVMEPAKPIETPAPVFPRYKYRFKSKPVEGKREEAEPFFSRGLKAQRDRRLADSMQAYHQALALDPSYFDANYNLAMAAHDAGDFQTSLGAYEKTLALQPESLNARYNFAYTLQEAGYPEDAVNELEKLLAQNPSETRAHLLMGNLCAQKLNRFVEARQQYVQVLKLEPRHPQATQIRYWLAAHP
ncbi:MAG: tetratricopeptide repeat protein, partial [Verrucomicrobiota bacterium]